MRFNVMGQDDSLQKVSEDIRKRAFSGTVMILEDNMIIALDAEEIFLELGAHSVEVMVSVAEASLALDARRFDFALLDVNLGDETSETIARRLYSEGIPFAFATGYGGASALIKQFENPVVIQKPFDRNSLENGLDRALDRLSG